MAYSELFERELLNYAREAQYSGVGSDGLATIDYLDINSVRPHLKLSRRSRRLSDRSFKSLVKDHLRVAEERGWIVRDKVGVGVFDVFRLTDSGFERLEKLEEQTFWPRAVKFLQGVIGTLFMSVLIPILVSILTVWALSWLELKSLNPSHL